MVLHFLSRTPTLGLTYDTKVVLNSNLMISSDFPQNIEIRLALSRKNFNGANLIFIICGKPGIVKFEFKTILVS